jgi:hypothetical protein
LTTTHKGEVKEGQRTFCWHLCLFSSWDKDWKLEKRENNHIWNM